MKKLLGYKRSDGQYGIRNKVLVMSSVGCANETARRAAEMVPGTVFIPAGKGCGQIGDSVEITKRTMTGFALNPNVFGVIIVGLGCETIQPFSLQDRITSLTDKPVFAFSIQEEGGTIKTIEKVAKAAAELLEESTKLTKTEFPISELVLATNCGGSDATSGLAANPALGYTSDLIVEQGGTSILGETTELIGTEHILAKRTKNEDVKVDILKIIEGLENEFAESGIDIRGANPSPGNQKGGLSTLEEKSLGAITKGGTTVINQVVKYGEIPVEKGLVVMDTPGYDIESVTGMVAGGAQICVFTTGRGTPIGNPIIPMIKITGNKITFENMIDNIDLDMSPIVDGRMSVEEGGRIILDEIIDVCDGKETKAEAFGFNEIAIYRNNEVWCCNL
ncbi:UxaA family hydrolase [Enterococcus sp. LJL120]